MACLSTSSFNPFYSLVGPYVASSPLSSPASPEWVLLDKTARISAFQNTATTAACDTGDGQAVQASFWLVDPPAVSYFSVHCPGLGEGDFSGEPAVVCAQGAFVLFRVSLSRGQTDSTYHFVYAARGAAGNPSLLLLPAPPDPDAQLGLLPCGGDHYAVAFLGRQWDARDHAWQFHAYVFSTKTPAWSKKPAFLSSESDRALLRPSARGSKQITVGASSLGWVDVSHGITLLCDPLDECPVIKYIPFPVPPLSKPRECLRDATACDDLIKFVQVDFDEPGCRMKGKRWRATTWIRKISWDNWHNHTAVDVTDISVDPRYSALLPEMWDDANQELELKKLVFLGSILGVGNDDLLYVMTKVDEGDIKAWVIAIGMKTKVVEGLAPVSTEHYSPTTFFSPCAFSSYLSNMTQGPDIGNPVDKYITRFSASQCIVQVRSTQRWFRELDKWLDSQGSACIECRRLLRYCCPASALRFDIQIVVKHASYNGQGEAAYKAVNFCLRALDDFDKLLREAPLSDPSTTEAMQSQISVVLGALDSILDFVPLTHMPRRVRMWLADDCIQLGEEALVFGHCEHQCHMKGRSDEEHQAGRSSPSNAVSGEARKKKRNRKKRKKKQQQKQAHFLDRQSWIQSWHLLSFVGCALAAVAVRLMCHHLGLL